MDANIKPHKHPNKKNKNTLRKAIKSTHPPQMPQKPLIENRSPESANRSIYTYTLDLPPPPVINSIIHEGLGIPYPKNVTIQVVSGILGANHPTYKGIFFIGSTPSSISSSRSRGQRLFVTSREYSVQHQLFQQQ